jgi:hypothetical protein
LALEIWGIAVAAVAAVVTAAIAAVVTAVVAAVVTGAGIVVTMVMGAISTGARKSEAELLVGTGGSDIETAAVALGLIFLGAGGGTEAVTACASTGFAGVVDTPLERATSCALWSGVMSRPLASKIVAKS